VIASKGGAGYLASALSKEDLLHLLKGIVTKKEQAHDLHGCEIPKLFPINVDTHDMGSLLVFLGIEEDVLDCAVDDVLGVPVKAGMGLGMV
jgi:hypothetical protein